MTNFVITTAQHTGPNERDHLPPNPIVSEVPFDFTGEEEYPYEAAVRIYLDGTVDVTSLTGLSPGFSSVREAVLWHWEQERAYEAHYERVEAEEREFQRTGRLVCKKCGERAVKQTVTPTRNYGGGYDTFYRCEHCGDSEVCT
jgi:DNA-directed RNA polymerase subunit M/transcription elongation factor TFIIS